MVNPGRGEVALVVGRGVSLTLRFTTGALSSLQTAFGFPYTAEGCAQLFQRLDSLDLADYPAAVFCASADRAGFPTLESIELLLLGGGDLTRVDAIRTAVSLALRLSFPDPEAKKANPKGELFSWSALKRAALRAGITNEAFWIMTPREVREVILAAAWRKDDSMAQTWLGAAWSRDGAKLPSITDFVSEEYAPKNAPKKPTDLLSLAKAWGSNVYDETGQLLVSSGVAVELKDKN